MNAKIEEMVNKGKLAATAGFEKGNEMMDKVPALKSKRNKLLVWGGIVVIVVLALVMLFGGGGSEEDAAVALNDACKAWLCERYGKDGVKKYEFESLQWNENRAILKADVEIDVEPSITDPARGFQANGTAVIYLENSDDGINVVDFELQ